MASMVELEEDMAILEMGMEPTDTEDMEDTDMADMAMEVMADTEAIHTVIMASTEDMVPTQACMLDTLATHTTLPLDGATNTTTTQIQTCFPRIRRSSKRTFPSTTFLSCTLQADTLQGEEALAEVAVQDPP